MTQAIAIVLGLMALGAALVIWPMLQVVWARDEKIRLQREKILALTASLMKAQEVANVQVLSEQAIDGAHDLSPADELGVLLAPGGSSTRPTEGRGPPVPG